MKKSEFLIRLQEALEGDVSTTTIQENVRYYDDYISGEVRDGKQEDAVIEELGDPWILARNITQAPEVLDATNVYGEDMHRENRNNYGSGGHTQIRIVNSWWKLMLILLCIVLVIIAVIVIVLGIIRFLAPVLIPLILILIVLRLVKNGSRE